MLFSSWVLLCDAMVTNAGLNEPSARHAAELNANGLGPTSRHDPSGSATSTGCPPVDSTATDSACERGRRFRAMFIRLAAVGSDSFVDQAAELDRFPDTVIVLEREHRGEPRLQPRRHPGLEKASGVHRALARIAFARCRCP